MRPIPHPFQCIHFRQFEDIKGTSIGGYDIGNLRYIDDAVLVSDTEDGVQRLKSSHSVKKNIIKEEKNKIKLNLFTEFRTVILLFEKY